MNRFDKLEGLLEVVGADEILHQIIENMSNSEGISLLEQIAIDLGIDDNDNEHDFDDYDYDNDNDDY